MLYCFVNFLKQRNTLATDFEKYSLCRRDKMSANQEDASLRFFFLHWRGRKSGWERERRERERASVRGLVRGQNIHKYAFCKTGVGVSYLSRANVRMYSSTGSAGFFCIRLSLTRSISRQVFVTGLIFHSSNKLCRWQTFSGGFSRLLLPPRLPLIFSIREKCCD